MNKKLLLVVGLSLTMVCKVEAACVLDEGITYPDFVGNAGGLVFSPDSAYLAVADFFPDNVVIFSTSGGVLSEKMSYSLPVFSNNPNGIVFSPDGSYLITSDRNSDDLTVFSFNGGVLSSGTSYNLPVGLDTPQHLAFSPDGSYVAVTSSPDVVSMFLFSNGVLSNDTAYAIPGSLNLPQSVAFSFDGTLLAIANFQTDDVTVYNVGTDGVLSGATSYPLPGGASGRFVLFTPDGKYVMVLSNSGGDPYTVVVYTLGAGVLENETQFNVATSSGGASTMAISSDGSCLVVTKFFSDLDTGGYVVEVFDLNDGVLSTEVAYPLPEGSEKPSAVAFSPDGLYVAVRNTGGVTLFRPSGVSDGVTDGSGTGVSSASPLESFLGEVY